MGNLSNEFICCSVAWWCGGAVPIKSVWYWGVAGMRPEYVCVCVLGRDVLGMTWGVATT